MKRTILWMLVCGAAMLTASGCSTAIKEGVGFATGAKGVYAPIDPVAADEKARPLGGYTHYELGHFTDDFGRTPPGLLQDLPAAFREELAEHDLLQRTGGRTLVINGTILHYESEDMVGIAIGPLEEVVVRTRLVDKETGKVLGTANCIGRTTNRVNTGVQKKAQGLAKAIVSWIDKRTPKPEDED